MKREFLEDLGLEKDVIDKIMDENGKDIELAKKPGETKDAEIEALKNQLKEANDEIKPYKDMNIDEIKESLESWKTKAEDHEKALEDLKNEGLLKDSIRDFKSVDEDVLLKLIDREALTFKDNEILGLKEQMEGLKEAKPYLFASDDPGDNRYTAHTPPENDGGRTSLMESTIASVFND